MVRKGKSRRSKTTNVTSPELDKCPPSNVSTYPPFWEFFASEDAVPKCLLSTQGWHEPQNCWMCLRQRMAYKTFTGGYDARTFMQLASAALAYEEKSGTHDSHNIFPFCQAALAYEPGNAFILCASGTYGQQWAENPADIENAVDDFTRAMKHSDAPLFFAEYNLAVLFDRLATTDAFEGISWTRDWNRTTCLIRAREMYQIALKAVPQLGRLAQPEERLMPTIILERLRLQATIKARLSRLADYKDDEHLPHPPILLIPTSCGMTTSTSRRARSRKARA